MAKVTMTLEGRALDRVLLLLADGYANAELRSRLMNAKRMVNAPWYDPPHSGDFKAWQKVNEAKRRSYKAALVSAVGELPPVADVGLGYSEHHKCGEFRHWATSQVAAQYARDLVAAVKALEVA